MHIKLKILRKTGLQKFLAIREFDGESRGNKAGFYLHHNWKKPYRNAFSTGKTFSVETLHTGKYNFLFFTIHLTLTGNDNLTPCPCTLSLKYQ
jgi:hypothetical protein